MPKSRWTIISCAGLGWRCWESGGIWAGGGPIRWLWCIPSSVLSPWTVTGDDLPIGKSGCLNGLVLRTHWRDRERELQVEAKSERIMDKEREVPFTYLYMLSCSQPEHFQLTFCKTCITRHRSECFVAQTALHLCCDCYITVTAFCDCYCGAHVLATWSQVGAAKAGSVFRIRFTTELGTESGAPAFGSGPLLKADQIIIMKYFCRRWVPWPWVSGNQDDLLRISRQELRKEAL